MAGLPIRDDRRDKLGMAGLWEKRFTAAAETAIATSS
jgi:hypothetical protein